VKPAEVNAPPARPPLDVEQAGEDLGERLSDRGPELPHEQHVAAGGDRQDRRGTRMPDDVVIVLEPRPPLAVDREDPTSGSTDRPSRG
jgi:hypothetical protein